MMRGIFIAQDRAAPHGLPQTVRPQKHALAHRPGTGHADRFRTFLPDDKLPAEALLCEEYAVSRPVLREATRVLVAKGLVYSKPRVGTVVKARREWHMLDPDVLHWLMQSSPQNEFFNVLTSVRSIIEPAAAALAAQHATDADIAAIGEAYQRMEAAPTPEALLQPDLDFHSRIADATHNDLLANLCNMLSVAIAEALKHSNQRPNLHELALPRHKAILTAIENRDALGCKACDAGAAG
jgi:GntR family galactonate operon transcriptional repressor